MTWPANIERWRQYSLWECKDIPVDLILAIIQHESAGVPGAISAGTTKKAEIPTFGGGSIVYDHAMGLMQVIPGTLASYNIGHPSSLVYYEDMIGIDERSTRLQIRVGCSIYASACRVLYNYDSATFPGASPGSATADQLMIALVNYAVGWGNTRPKLDELKAGGVTLTFQALADHYPNWGQNSAGEWINRPIHYAQTTWNSAINHGMMPGQSNLNPTEPGLLPSIPGGMSLPLLIAVVMFAYKLWKGWHK